MAFRKSHRKRDHRLEERQREKECKVGPRDERDENYQEDHEDSREEAAEVRKLCGVSALRPGAQGGQSRQPLLELQNEKKPGRRRPH